MMDIKHLITPTVCIDQTGLKQIECWTGLLECGGNNVVKRTHKGSGVGI